MNIRLLKEKLQKAKYQKGIKDKDLAAAMNITPQAFSQKKKGESNFTSEQQKIIVRILGLSKEEAFDIFLTDEGDENGQT